MEQRATKAQNFFWIGKRIPVFVGLLLDAGYLQQVAGLLGVTNAAFEKDNFILLSIELPPYPNPFPVRGRTRRCRKSCTSISRYVSNPSKVSGARVSSKSKTIAIRLHRGFVEVEVSLGFWAVKDIE